MRRTYPRLIAAFAVMALLFSTGANLVNTSAQSATAPAPQVIAHGVDSFDGSTMMWQVTTAEATADQNTSPTQTPTGFVVATEGPLTIADTTIRRGDYLRPGSAAFHPSGTTRAVIASESATTYTQISLSAEALGGDYTSREVQTPNGSRAVELSAGHLTSGSNVSYAPPNEFAFLLHVTSGSLQITDDENSTFDLSAGDSLTITGDIRMSASGDANYLIANIGPEVQIPAMEGDATGTGTLTVRQFDCPAGTDPGSDSGACTPVEDPWVVNIHPSGRDASDTTADLNIPGDGVEENGSWTWTEMSEGTWNITPAPVEEGAAFSIVVTGATEEDGHYNADITAGKETVVSIYIIGERPTGNGWLDLIAVHCDGEIPSPLSRDMPGCTPVDAAPEFHLSRVNDDATTFTEADVVRSEDGSYRLSEMPPGVYTISFNTPESGDARVGGDLQGATGIMRYTIYVTAGQGTFVIHATSDDYPVSEGTATFVYFVCTAESTDPVNDPNCTQQPLPGPVVLVSAADANIRFDSSAGSTDQSGNPLVVVPTGEYQIEIGFTAQGTFSSYDFINVTEGENTTLYIIDVVAPSPDAEATPPQ